MASAQELEPFDALAREFGLMDPRAQDLLLQAAVEIARMMRHGDHYRRHANRRVDLLSAAKHIDGLRRAFSRLDAATIVSAFVSLGAREAVLVDYELQDCSDEVSTVPNETQGKKKIDLLPLRWMAFETLSHELAEVHKTLLAMAGKEILDGPGRPVVSDPIIFGIECMAALWAKYRPNAPIRSSNKRGTFGSFVQSFFGITRKRMANDELLDKKLDSVARNLTDVVVRSALRKFLGERIEPAAQ